MKIKKIILTTLSCIMLSFLLIGCEANNDKQSTKKINTASKLSLQKDVKKDVKEDVKENKIKKVEKQEKKESPKSEIKNKTEDEVLLKIGDKGNKVFELQKKLYTIGYDLNIDGCFGNKTVAVVKEFQRQYKLIVSGNLTKNTQEKLNKVPDKRKYEVTKTSSRVVTKTANAQKSTNTLKQNGYTVIPNIKTNPGNSEQVIVVIANSYGTEYAQYYAYEKINGSWKEYSNGPAVIGRAGFKNNRREGDKSTPTGKYGFPFMFGRNSNPGVKFEYRKVRKNDYWVSNTNLPEYNVWMHYEGNNAVSRLKDFEKLWEQPLYNYAAVIDYNYYTGSKVMGKGSGIFLHIAPYSGRGTAGCVGLSQSNLLKILKWMDPSKNPTIIMGVRGHI